jgi:hypothetical protein
MMLERPNKNNRARIRLDIAEGDVKAQNFDHLVNRRRAATSREEHHILSTTASNFRIDCFCYNLASFVPKASGLKARDRARCVRVAIKGQHLEAKTRGRSTRNRTKFSY